MTNFLVKIFIKDFNDTKNTAVREKYGIFAGFVGIFCNITLFLGKFFAGIITGAISITADAFNNLSDAGSSIVTLVGFKMAGKPADKDHPFGHGRMEYVSGLFVSLLILLMGFELGKSSLEKIFNPEFVDFSLVSIIILICSILLKFWMYFFNRYLSKKINSEAMMATAKDSLSDTIATSAVVIGALISKFTNLQLDGYIGLLVAIFILISGFNTVKDTLNPLLGEKPTDEFVNDVTSCVLAHKEIVGIHDLIVHNYGPGRCMMSLHAEVPSSLDVLKAHDAIDIIEYELKEKFKCDAVIHMDPIVVDDKIANDTKEFVIKLVNSIDSSLSIHDFRMTKGPLHSNLIFDLVVPFDFKLKDEDIKKKIDEEINKLDENYYAVIHFDRNYV